MKPHPPLRFIHGTSSGLNGTVFVSEIPVYRGDQSALFNLNPTPTQAYRTVLEIPVEQARRT